MKDRWLSSTEFAVTDDGVKASATKVIPKGNVVIATRVGLGKVVQVEQPTAINQDLRAIIPKATAKLDPNFIFYWYQTVSKQVISAGTGATVQGVKIPTIANLQIPLPPLDEQKRIVAKLDKVMELVSGSLVRLASQMDSISVFPSSYIRLLLDSDEWDRIPLGQLASWRGGLTPSTKNPEYWEGGDIPWISSKDVKVLNLTSTERLITSVALAESSLELAPRGCVAVVVRSGVLAHTFPVTYVPFETTVNQDIKIGIPNENVVDGRFLSEVLSASSSAVLRNCRKEGATVQSIEVDSLMRFELPIPPLQEQKRVLAKLNEVTRNSVKLKDLLLEQKNLALDLKASSLAAAFVGQL